MARKRLTKKQQAFVEAMADPTVKSHKEAALKAGYSETCAKEVGYKNTSNPEIAAYIDQRKKEIAAYHKISPEFVTGGIVKLALEAEENNVKLGAFKTLGNYLQLENAPKNEQDSRVAFIKNAIQARAAEKGVTYEQELRNYLDHYALPDIKEKLVSELEN